MRTDLIDQCRKLLKRQYGAKLAGLVVYGSEARNSSDGESDLDLLVLLSSPFDYFSELRLLVELLYPVQLENDRLISAKPALVERFEKGTLQLYRNAKREGVCL